MFYITQSEGFAVPWESVAGNGKDVLLGQVLCSLLSG